MKIFKRIAVSAAIGILLFFAYLMIAYGPKHIIGYFTHLRAPGNGDWQIFPSRKINKPDTAFHFKKKLEESYIETLFKDRIRILGLTTFEEYIEKTHTTALIVVKNDTIIYEKYFNGFRRNDLSMAMSMTKSFVNSLVGIAMDEGYIKSVDEPITNYLPELKERGPNFSQITLKHLLMMCSGIDRQQSAINGIPLPWDGKSITFGHPQLRKYILKRLDIHSAPGKQFNYTDYNAELLGLILERAIGKSVSAYLEEKIWKPCEMEYPALWLLDSKKSGFEKKSCGLYARPIDYAKYGRLYLNRGTWNGRRVIPEAWVMESTREDIQTDQLNYYPPGWLRNTYYKYHWKGFVNPDATISLSIGGDMGQNIYISPQKNLIIVHCGSKNSRYGVEDLWDIERQIDNPFFDLLHSQGLAEAMVYLEAMTQTARISLVSERQLNTVGYGFLYENKLDAAMTVFKHVVEIFPSSWNAYDSLAEAYMENGQKEMAMKNYEKSLALNPDNENAKEMINKLNN